MAKPLLVTSPAFVEGGVIPVRHTGYGEDISPEIILSPLDERAKSLVVLMDDLDHPLPAYSHWVLFNIPPIQALPEGIPHGAQVPSLGGAIQGRGYGRNRYAGPKPPFNWSHRYRYAVYALDCLLCLGSDARKKDVLRAMKGHVLGEGSLTGRYR